MKPKMIQNSPSETVPKIFARTVRKYGDRVALRRKTLGIWEDISWNDYYTAAGQIGLALVALGLKKGDRVAIIGENCPEWVFIDLGVQCVGGVTVGIYTTSSAEQCQYLINHSESKFFFVQNEEQLDKWLSFKANAPQLQKVIVWDLTGLRHFQDAQVMSLAALLDLGQEEVRKHPGLFETLIDTVKPE
ncbi:MAG: long-chain fatty acid--CoA ligase, partial [Calditrichaeota bacterium]